MPQRQHERTVRDLIVAVDAHGEPISRRRSSIAGTSALIAIILQFPWLLPATLMAWLDTGGINSNSKLYAAFAILPTLLAICLGIFSVLRSGFGKRNDRGVIALILVGCEVLFVLLLIVFRR